ncbi:cytochrome c3 family protein [Desulfurobacterium atlanticum]|uniref:Cytochrome c-type protein n=1 Tax=Desulfurobacterium atlanticum TaxID=240169 RepID=A0A238YRH1_9BACT|nr:NapC/NirT family cytochrome c [Desulfurobacterium atlanticum]SNR73408.1 cytochrome c-type protein NapC [Desulfurobacterium atlanticum]
MLKQKKAYLCFGGLVVGLIISLAVAQGVKYSSTEQFCASCHEMKFAYDAWEENAHGPLSSDAGACKATCVDCHLPHDANVVTYLLVKTKAAVKDVVGHFTGPENFDWVGNLEERNRYTYESSCKGCHKVLSDNVMHEKYKKGEIKETCIDCHHGVGHGYYFRETVERLFGKKEVAKK